MLRIRIRIRIRIRMFLGLLDPDPLVRGMVPDLAKKNLDSYRFFDFFDFFIFLEDDVNVPSKSNKQKNFF